MSTTTDIKIQTGTIPDNLKEIFGTFISNPEIDKIDFYLNKNVDKILDCFEQLDESRFSDDCVLESLLNDTGKARKWFNQITRPNRQFFHTTDYPISTVNWSDTNLNNIPKEVMQILLIWKRKSQTRISKRWKQRLSFTENLHSFPRPSYMDRLEVNNKPEVDLELLNDKKVDIIPPANDVTNKTNEIVQDTDSNKINKTMEDKLPNVALGTYQKTITSARNEEETKISEIVNALPDLSFYF